LRTKKIIRVLGMILSAVVFLGGCAAQNNEAKKAPEGSAEGLAVGVLAEEAAQDAADQAEVAAEGEVVQSMMAAGAESLTGGEPASRIAGEFQAASYGQKEAWIRSEKAEVRYPIIEGLGDLELQNEINDAIFSAVNGYVVSANDDGDQVTLDYEITRMDNEILSVVVRGLQPHEKSTYDVMFSVNLVADTSRQVNASTLFLNDEASKKALTALLKSADETFASEFGPWLGIYFEAESLNFFYLENDKAAVYNVISVPLEELMPYFKEMPWKADDAEVEAEVTESEAESKP
jgi:hypothetical protein